MQGNHSFNIILAKKYSIEEALLLSHIHYWCEINKNNNNNFHEGKYWTYNSYESFANTFIYLSPRQVRSVLGKLEENGLIESGNFNKLAIDKTKWYTVTEKGLKELKQAANNSVIELSDDCQNRQTIRQNCHSKSDKIVNPSDYNVKAIPDINTNINLKSNTNKIYTTPFPQPKEDKVKKQSFSKSDYTDCVKLISSCQNTLRAKGIQIDETQYPIPTLNKWLKKWFLEYGVEQTKKCITNSVTNNWLVNTTHYSISAMFSDTVFPKLANTQVFSSKVNVNQNEKHHQLDYVQCAEDMKSGQEF